MSLSAGGSGTFTINFTVTGNQDSTGTFTVDRDWSLAGGTFTGSNPQTFTVNARSPQDPPTTFSTTGSVSVTSGQASGTFTLAIGAYGITNANQQGAKLASGAAASYKVIVSPPADSTPPVITPSISGTQGLNGWYTSNVTVSWSVTDAQSAVSSQQGCGSTTVSSDTTGTTFTCSATSAGGTDSKSVTIKRDATAPTFTATPSVAPNANGYNNTSVDVSYTCSDATSTLADTCPEADHATTDGTHVFSHTIHDKAGNASSVSTTVTIDGTKPTISGTRTPGANGYGWNNGNVTVSFECGDVGGSGVATCVADGTSPASTSKVLSSEGASQSVSGTATDNAGNTNSATVSGINIDTTPPTISYVSRTPANGNGWNAGDVTVTWSCADTRSGVVSATVTQTLTNNGADQSTTGTCTDEAGNSASNTQSGINIDKTAPSITFYDRSPDANGAGWNNSDVTVSWTCSDDVSDVLHASVSDATTDEGADQSLTGVCEDLAGNTADDTYTGINVDKTAPNAPTSHVSPAPNSDTWNNTTPVTVSFTSNGDNGPSGNVVCTSNTVITAETAGQNVSGTCTDAAGNTSGTASVTVKVDTTAPNAPLLVTTPAAPAYGDWFKDSVTVTPTSNGDAGTVQSGVNTALLPTATTFNTSGTHGPVTAKATDFAGNVSSEATLSVKVDADKPTVRLTCPAPIVLGSTASATWTASDNESGLDGAASGSVSLDTSSVGTKTATLAAGSVKDKVGHGNDVAVCDYSVVFSWNGFLAPVDNGGVLNAVKNGQTVPLKWSIPNGTGFVSSLDVVKSITNKAVNCDSSAPLDDVEITTTGGTVLRYDSTANQYIYNWQTPKTAGKCYQVTVTLTDNSTHSALFKLK